LFEEGVRSLDVACPPSFDGQTLEHVRDPPIVAEASIFRESPLDVSRARFEVTDDVGSASQGTDSAHVQFSRYVDAALEEFRQQARAFGSARGDPVLLQGDGEAHGTFDFICAEQPVEGGADVRLLGQDKFVMRASTRGD